MTLQHFHHWVVLPPMVPPFMDQVPKVAKARHSQDKLALVDLDPQAAPVHRKQLALMTHLELKAPSQAAVVSPEQVNPEQVINLAGRVTVAGAHQAARAAITSELRATSVLRQNLETLAPRASANRVVGRPLATAKAARLEDLMALLTRVVTVHQAPVTQAAGVKLEASERLVLMHHLRLEMDKALLL